MYGNKVQKEIIDPLQVNRNKFAAAVGEQLAELFPSVLKDGVFDFEALFAELGWYAETEERYELNWIGKVNAKRIAQTESLGKTMNYIPEDSKLAEATDNLYIEGDNLEVLKLLRNSYYNQIKMIYIDPPYNTGNDFVYRDKFAMSSKEHSQSAGETNEAGERLIVNQRSGGRIHSNWLNMMYPRLRAAKELLAEDGVLFISIDDHEYSNLKLICDEIFREENMLGVLARKTKLTSNKGTYFASSHEYILAYAKNIGSVGMFHDPEAQEEEDYVKLFKHEDEAGKYNIVSLYMPSLDVRPNQRYYIECPDGSQVIPPEGKVYRWTQETFERNLKENRIVFKETATSPLLNEEGKQAKWNIYTKIYLHERRESGLRPVTILDKYPNSAGTKELIKLGIPFPFSKPKELIMYLMKIANITEGYILDFFSGSATTAHAVMQLNAEDGGRRNFIMVQIPEICDEKSNARKAGYTNICEIGKERIRRAGELIAGNADTGFKVFRLAETNIRWFHKDAAAEMFSVEEALNDKDRIDFLPGFTDLNVVYELLLRHKSIPLTAKVEPLRTVSNRTYMIASKVAVCLEAEISEELLERMAGITPAPVKMIFRDSAYGANISLKEYTIARLTSRPKQAGTGNMTYRVEFI